MAAAQTAFDSIAIWHGDFLDLTGSGETQRLSVNFVSPSLFTLTGRTAILGRTFNSQEDVAHGPLLAVISERFWRNHFNRDPGVIGKKLTLSEQSFEIVGVAPTQVDLWGPPPTDVYLPVNSMTLFSYPIYQRNYRIFGCLGRLKDGFSIAQAETGLELINNQLIARYPDTNKGYSVRLTPLLENVVSGYSGTVWLLGAAVAFLLLIAAANVANLLFVRGLERRRELAIRAAVGATRSRLVGQLLLETGVPVPNIRTFDDLIAQKLMTRKLAGTLVSLFSGAALCLSAIGLYGVLAYSVSRRRREIGVRIALGAESLRILQLVAQQGFKVIGIGLVAGIALALVCARLIEGMLYGVSAADPISLLCAILVLCLAGCLACLLPALRATQLTK